METGEVGSQKGYVQHALISPFVLWQLVYNIAAHCVHKCLWLTDLLVYGFSSVGYVAVSSGVGSAGLLSWSAGIPPTSGCCIVVSNRMGLPRIDLERAKATGGSVLHALTQASGPERK